MRDVVIVVWEYRPGLKVALVLPGEFEQSACQLLESFSGSKEMLFPIGSCGDDVGAGLAEKMLRAVGPTLHGANETMIRHGHFVEAVKGGGESPHSILYPIAMYNIGYHK